MFLAWDYTLPLMLLLTLGGCASPKAPTGGPNDESPPVVVEDASTPNFQTNFKPDEITITFDEWFTLKDVAAQVVISPLMPEDPEIKQKGKSIIIVVPDSLREETTYTINFGSSIADLNEGNILENYAFVFSTGDVLDSIKLSGKVTHALTLAPADGVWVILYPAGEDSAVYKRKPEYVAKTNKEGKWAMSNIRADSFNVVALKDDNINFLYDQETELIGWLEEPINTATTVSILPEIRVFPKEKRTGIREVIHQVPGWIKIVVDAPAVKPIPELIPPIENTMTSWDGDTLHIWYAPGQPYSGKAVVAKDTSTIRQPVGLSLATAPLKIAAVSGRLHPTGSARFMSVVPLTSIDTSRIKLTLDSLGTIPYMLTIDSFSDRKFSIHAAWKPLARHTLTFLPGAVKDFWGRTNDTIRHSIVVHGADQYGDLTLKVEGLDSTKNYILLLKTGEQIEARFVIEQQKTAQLKRGALSPGKYGGELIEDLNSNGIWDTGDYATRRQPERKMNFTIDNIRAAWEVESTILWLP
jgi:hypothetical protein